MMAAFAAALVVALLRGRAGAPCACFGSRSVVGWPGVARNVVLAAAFAALPLLPDRSLSTDEWLGIGLAAALLGCLGLAIAVLALAREVGMLRLRLGSDSALEIPDEGPELGARSGVIARFSPGERAELALAVFVSRSCAACAALEPAIESLAGEPMLAVESFEEGDEPGVWAELGIPGQPLRGGHGARRDGARQGHLQQPRPARERARDGRAPRHRGHVGAGRWLRGPGASSGRWTASRATRRGAGFWRASAGR